MFRLKSIVICGFWGRGTVECEFSHDVNIIIGRNGTGKTTLMNILNSALTCDLNGLVENDFEEVIIQLESSEIAKTIRVERNLAAIDEIRSDRQSEFIVYSIDNKIYELPFLFSLDRRYSPMQRRRIDEQTSEVRKALSGLLNTSSISVYRLRHDEDFEVRDRYGERVISPVDYRVEEVLNELAHYIAELGVKEQEVSRQLQKNVLTSILYSPDEGDENFDLLGFDKNAEEENLKRAYSQLNAMDGEVFKKILSHVEAVASVINRLKNREGDIDIKPLEAYSKTRKVIDLSLEANEEIAVIRKQIELFLKKLREFMPEKNFKIESGKLIVSNAHGDIKIRKLSSGEKQLIILLIEALLQREEEYLLLADEPEISLHIEWQGKVIPAVRELNPNAQVIVATHSPEVAVPYRNKIFNMKDIYHE